jgi:hypothetical protein
MPFIGIYQSDLKKQQAPAFSGRGGREKLNIDVRLKSLILLWQIGIIGA